MPCSHCCSRPRASACQGETARPNILLVSIDTLRADHLGCYGYDRETSPVLDALAAHSVLYENAFAPAPWTLPSHVAMLSGRHPANVGIQDANGAIPPTVPMLAEALSLSGYQTAGIVDSTKDGFVGAKRGFGRGFDAFVHRPAEKGARTQGPHENDVAASVDLALEWLGARDPARPFFLFLHTKSVHNAPAASKRAIGSALPYDPPPAYRERFLPGGARFPWEEEELRGGAYLYLMNRLIARAVRSPADFEPASLEELAALYDAGIRYVDTELGRLLSALADMGVADETLVVVTADHGEAFLEHRFFLHREVYDELLRVPLILSDPRDRRGVRVRQPVALADIVPTILDRVGIGAGGEYDGTPLPRADEAAPERRMFHYFRYGPDAETESFALRQGRWKLVRHRTVAQPEFATEIYDTEADPREQSPAAADPERVANMGAELDAHIESLGAGGARIDIGPETRERLRALGYAQ